MQPTPKNYRADIDGLRAVAVLAVLFHHLSASLLPGGYAGVDIFFVISGYLITAQIRQEAVAGTFSLRHFYQRRINRIVPALVAVVAATLLAGALLLSPADLVLLVKSAACTLLGVSNVFFWQEYGNYFASVAAEAPLLHTWSLGVEEQFYLVWPLFIVLLFKFVRGKTAAIMLTLLTLLAIAVSELGTRTVASASYYLLPTRFFELMLGGVLALATAQGQRLPRAFAGASGIAGLLLVAGSLALLTKTSTFPGINALWPALGSALLILAGSTGPVARLLTARPMVFTGQISYSLYLWHWPLIAYLNYLNVKIGPGTGAGVVVAAFACAWLSWKFVETPLRRSGARMAFGPVFLRRFALPLAAVLLVAGVTVQQAGFPARFDSQVSAFEKDMATKPNILRKGCHVPNALYATPPSPRCRLGATRPVPDAILIGDSFANHFTGMIDVMARAQGLAVLDYTMDGCPPLLDYADSPSPLYAERCRARNKAAFAAATAPPFTQVILAGSWPQDAEAGERLAASAGAILASGAKLTIILNNESIERATQCPLRKLMYGSQAPCMAPPRGVPAYFSALQQRYPALRVVDPNRVICAGGMCNPVSGSTLLYRDAAHLNDAGSRLIGQALVAQGVRL
jgi:peptidoglycan/LPS O-acetylase OafA/YrhL